MFVVAAIFYVLALLPTAPAHLFMGNIERDAGNIAAAREHYVQAARTDSQAGESSSNQP